MVKTLRRGREADRGAERALGSSAFVAALQRPAASAAPGAPTSRWSAAATPAAPSRTPWASVPRPSTRPSPAVARHAASGEVSRNNELFYLATPILALALATFRTAQGGLGGGAVPTDTPPQGPQGSSA